MTATKQPKRILTLRVSHEGRALLDLLGTKMALSQTATVEQAIRLLAKREGIKMPKTQKEEKTDE